MTCAGRIKFYLQWHGDVESQMLSCLPELEISSTRNCSSLKRCVGISIGNGDTKKGDSSQNDMLFTGKEADWEPSLCFSAQGMK